MPPMCQFSVRNKDRFPTKWHYMHYVSRAIGGAGLIVIYINYVITLNLNRTAEV